MRHAACQHIYRHLYAKFSEAGVGLIQNDSQCQVVEQTFNYQRAWTLRGPDGNAGEGLQGVLTMSFHLLLTLCIQCHSPSLSLYFVCYLIKQQKAEMPADRQVRNKAFINLSSRLWPIFKSLITELGSRVHVNSHYPLHFCPLCLSVFVDLHFIGVRVWFVFFKMYFGCGSDQKRGFYLNVVTPVKLILY